MTARRRLRSLLLIAVAGIAVMVPAGRSDGVLASQTTAAAPATAVISGIVVEGERGVPVAFASVNLQRDGYAIPAREVSGEDGRFAFRDVSPGSYHLVASRTGYAAVYFKGGGPFGTDRGPAFTIAGGQRLNDVELKLIRGGVITGRVLDEFGEPVHDASISFERLDRTLGDDTSRFYALASMFSTDARGHYRLYGLPPGEYIVGVSHYSLGVRLGSTTGPAIDFLPAYYANASDPKRATPISVGPGEERVGIDLRLRTAALSSVEGKLIVPAGVDPQLVSVRLEPAPGETGGTDFGVTRVAADGSFRSQVLPARYALAATFDPAMHSPSRQDEPQLWAASIVTVGNEDVKGLSLLLQPAMRLTGRVVFAAGSPTLDLAHLTVSLVPLDPDSTIDIHPSDGSLDANGRFTITGITPGRYRFAMPSGLLVTIRITSATIEGAKVGDDGFEVQQGVNVDQVVLTVRIERER
jgi:hypothetical protein